MQIKLKGGSRDGETVNVREYPPQGVLKVPVRMTSILSFQIWNKMKKPPEPRVIKIEQYRITDFGNGGTAQFMG